MRASFTHRPMATSTPTGRFSPQRKQRDRQTRLCRDAEAGGWTLRASLHGPPGQWPALGERHRHVRARPSTETRQTFVADASRIFEEIERNGGEIHAKADYDFYRAVPSGGYGKGLAHSDRTEPGLSEGPFRERMEPMPRPSRYSPELRERAIRMVFDHAPEHPSQWAAIRSVGEKLGIRTESLRRWVRQAERDTGQRPGLTTSEREELKRLQRENFELKRANEILRKASAFFAQAELDRRAK